ncbi:MAG TPA: molybdate ABC transporter substrate-binding protein [Vicinamibacterales bacterium]|nr:molybdate ABC transporter substrate-binding protein [Vicinamibacterales bacterium]
MLVSAAASLTDALTAVAADFERETGVHVTANFGSSSGLARQIVNGAPVDLFLTADEAQMDVVEQAGFVERGTRIDLLRNQLVVVMPRGSRPLASPRDLAAGSIRRIALADPAAVPAGVYARRYLESIGLWSAVAPKVVPMLDVRAALAASDSGNVDAAFVYKTDASIARHSTVVFSVPLADGPRIVYPAAVIKDARHGDAARRFLAYLRGGAARRVFERYGFVVATDGQ